LRADAVRTRDAILRWNSVGIRSKACALDERTIMAEETETSVIDAALARLEAAVNRMDAVVQHRLEKAALPDDRDAELALMDEDRARLAAALDAASARLAEVTATTGEVGHRLDRAIQTVQDVLGRA
jgi:hypothetical protein